KKPKAQITPSLTQTTNSNDIVTRILSTPLTLSVGEVIGVSKDVPQHLQDLIQFKSNAIPPAASYFTQDRSLLIYLPVECRDIPITATIDSGSTINVMNKHIWE
ncbi:hypothetical protein BJ138DRAFT_973717, partial [Hygrophoropsis aurantiaca]